METVGKDISCLLTILEYNAAHGILFFRITSELVPFASHPVCSFDWPVHFSTEFGTVGEFIREHNIRISMHPDQFVLINALDADIVERSIKELEYHARVLDSLGLDESAKIQIYTGGVYGNHASSLSRFGQNYHLLHPPVRRRLVIENDGRAYT